MPLYEYRCTNCGYQFEKIQKFSDAPERVCPRCQGELVRPMTAPALKFEGAGWYINDYAAKGGPAASGNESKTESKAPDAANSASAPASPASGASTGSGSSVSGSSGSGASGSTSSGAGSSGSTATGSGASS